jgi:tRNA 2-thiouridine synthesizing protein A
VTQVDVDCRGVPCPRPIIELARAMVQAEVGDTVAVTADDPAVRIDVEAWCRMRAQEYVGQELAPDGVPTYVVRRVS